MLIYGIKVLRIIIFLENKQIKNYWSKKSSEKGELDKFWICWTGFPILWQSNKDVALLAVMMNVFNRCNLLVVMLVYYKCEGYVYNYLYA